MKYPALKVCPNCWNGFHTVRVHIKNLSPAKRATRMGGKTCPVLCLCDRSGERNTTAIVSKTGSPKCPIAAKVAGLVATTAYPQIRRRYANQAKVPVLVRRSGSAIDPNRRNAHATIMRHLGIGCDSLFSSRMVCRQAETVQQNIGKEQYRYYPILNVSAVEETRCSCFRFCQVYDEEGEKTPRQVNVSGEHPFCCSSVIQSVSGAELAR